LDRPTPARLRAWLAGTLAGLVLGLGDWIASGVSRVPASLALASLLGGTLAGALAGGLAAAFGRPRLGVALVLAGAIALEGASSASKGLTNASRALGILLAAALALASLAALLRETADVGKAPIVLGALVALPAGSYLAGELPTRPWAPVLASGAPLAWLILVRLGRHRREVHALGWLGLLLALLSAQRGPAPAVRKAPLAPSPAAASSSPSLVLLVVDTLRADALPSGGALAEFAREGVEFRQCVSAAPWTLPSVSSLLTGLLPSQHGAVTAATALPEDLTTLAERLHAQGYATAAFSGGAFVGAGHGLDQGFQTFDPRCERRFEPFGARTPLVWRVARNRYFPLRWLVRWVDESRGLAGVLAAAVGWAAREPHRPKFVFLHTNPVHDYYLYDPDLDDAVLAGRTAPSRFAGRLSVHPEELWQVSQAELEHFRALYEGRVVALDRLFPELVRALTPHVGEDALWVVTADHGEGFDAAGGRVHHGGRLHEDLLRVPLILRAKGRLEPGTVVEESVRSVDVLPTVLDLAGLPVPDGLAGESLLPALRGERPFPSSAFAEERAHGFELVAVRRAGWKLVRGPGHAELYHLEQDPLERRPLSLEPPEPLRAELETFPTRFPAREREEAVLDSATLKHLRALGYVR
jgi:arylsulfatase A-like enzyme